MKTFGKLLLLTFLVSFCANTSVLAGNSDKTENRTLKNFNKIEVSAGIDLFITMGNEEKVIIVADDEIIDNVITEVNDGTLKIYMKNNNKWFNWGSFTKSRKAYVTVKELEKIDASSGSDVKSENTLQGENLEIEASSGSDVIIDVIYKNINADASSGSDIKITGKSKNLTVEASSGSDINARGLETSICHAIASSGSDIIVNVTSEFVARASSGSDIVYYGKPTMKNIDESSGADIAGR